MQEYLADLHIHSRFSLATSKKLDLTLLAAWAGIKGLQVIGSGDFTHPKWREEMRAQLRFDEESRLYRLKDEEAIHRDLPGLPHCGPALGREGETARIMLQGEINLIYRRAGKLRKVHALVYMPDLDTADTFCRRLEQIGNLKADGRPVIGLDARDLLEMVLESHPRAFLIPAHIWTPWFSLFGSKSGFDRLEDCFDDLSPEIFALETGLSSDPAMNRLWSALDACRLVSNSDAHSGEKLGREANVFAGKISYDGILQALKEPEKPGETVFRGTLEFFPEEGKYHMDGHRACGVRLSPKESRECGGLCPVCGKPLNIGVLNRVMELADRDSPVYPPLAALPGPEAGPEADTEAHPEASRVAAFAGQTKPVFSGEKGFSSLVPLPEILSEILGSPAKSRKVELMYADLLGAFGPELHILRAVPPDELARRLPPLGEAVRRMRRSEVRLAGGYDGEYGRVSMFAAEEIRDIRQGYWPTGQSAFARPAQRLSLPGCAAGIAHADSRKEKRAVQDATRSSGKTPAPGKAASKKTASEEPSAEKWVKRGGFLFFEGEEEADAPAPDQSAPVPEGNPEQERAVVAGPGPVLVSAGPGSGKTRTLIARIRYLLDQGIDPRRILAVTFTRRAAAEIDARLAAEFGQDALLPRTDTLHALGLELWHKSQADPPVLLNEESSLSVFAEANAGEKPQRLKAAWRELNLAREKLLPTPAQYAQNAAFYTEQKNAWNLADYTDLLEFFLERLEGGLYAPPYEHVLVDEIQDLSPLQLCVIRALVNGNGLAGEGFFGIGDPDQSIYSFRGAGGDSLAFFRKAWPHMEVVRLRVNYRSRPGIVRSATALLAASGRGEEETLMLPRRSGEAVIRLFSAPTAEDEAAWVSGRIADLLGPGGHTQSDMRPQRDSAGLVPPEDEHSPGDIAVLVRTHALAQVYRKALDNKNIPVAQPAAEGFWADERAAMILRAAGRMLGIAATSAAQERDLPDLPAAVFSKGPHGIAAYLDKTPPFDPLFRQSSAFRALLRAYEETGGWPGLLTYAALMDELELTRAKGEKVQILSLHAAKGLEFRSVFLPALEDGLLPFAGPLFLTGKAEERAADADPQEELRLFYVGITRARDRLYLSHAARRFFYGREIRLRPSPFLDKLPEETISRSVLVTRTRHKEKQLSLFPGK
ncbi:MAG: UvrD-helicase domain-containing protein [Desulfovibrio sp.]|jgi:superfamily I DNA/RNA helicase/PHP family Zn ribbon phosphoesterase|nr:UvrD-helicase domain-containing protein [Desulfovibrio sp.]